MAINLVKTSSAKALIVSLILVHAGSAIANTENRSWHFYNEVLPAEKAPDPPVVEEAKPKPEETKEPAKEPDKTVTIALESEPQAAGEPISTVIGSSAWLTEHLPKMRELAMDNPTRDNIRLYVYFERVAFDKADRFATVYEQVQKTTPMLSENMKRPTSMQARETIGAKIRAGMDAATRTILNDNALVFFFKGNCELCEVQAKELSLMKRRYGATILPVSVDGQSLSSGLFPEFKVDQGQAELIGIPTYPAVVVYEPASEAWVPVNYGFKARGDLMVTLTEFGLERGWITNEQYAATKTTTYDHLIEVPINESDLPEVPKEYINLFESLVQRNAHE